MNMSLTAGVIILFVLLFRQFIILSHHTLLHIIFTSFMLAEEMLIMLSSI